MVQQQAHYNDDTPNNFPDDYDDTKVDSRVKLRSKAIRGKYRGVDVRGALAQGIEIAGEIAGESVESATDAKNMSQDTQNRFDDQINGKVDPNEVIDARRPTGGDAFDTLKLRLDAQDDATRDKVGSSQFELSATLATMRRLGRLIRKQGEVSSNAQGFAGLGDTTVVQYFQNVFPLDSQSGSLVKFDVVTGEIITENPIQGFHGNSMTYDSNDKMLYLAPAEDSSGIETTQRTQVFKIDPDSLLVVEKIDLTGKTVLNPIHSIGYDATDHCFVIADNDNLEFYNDDWEIQFSLTFTELLGFTPGFMQGVQCNGDVLYWIGGRKSQIWAFKINYAKQTLDYQTTYNFDDYQENVYPTAEIEGLAFNRTTGEIYVNSHIAVGRWSGISQYFVTNRNFKVAFSGSSLVSTQVSRIVPAEINVGENDEYNPVGTAAHPFNNLLEATMIMRSPYIEFPNLHFRGDFDDTLLLTDMDGALITQDGHTVRAVVMSNVRNVYFTQLNTTGRSSYKHNALYAYNAQFRVNTATLSGLADGRDEYGIYLERSRAFIGSVTGGNVYLKNTELTSVASNFELVKENNSSRLHGQTIALTATSVAGVATGLPDNAATFSKICMAATINTADATMTFYSTRDFGGIVDMSDYRMYRDQLYFGMFHLSKGDATNSTFHLWKLVNGAMVEQAVTSMSIAVMLGD
jgi:hypothetical protein